MPTLHPTKPTPDQGAIIVWAEREHAVSAFRISAPAGAVQVHDLDMREVLPAASPAAAEEALGPIVYPDLPSYKRSSAWRLAQVLEALGVHAGELAEVELEDPEDEEVVLDEVEAYDFTGYPPGYRPSVLGGAHDVYETIKEAVGTIIERSADKSGEHVVISPETERQVIEAGQAAVDARWPGAFRVGCEFKHGQLAIALRVQVNAAEHAAAWAAFMTDQIPRGYEAEGIGGKVEWSCPARPSEGRTVSFYVDAIAECWRAYLHRDADVCADLLGLAGVWDGMCPTEGVQAGRIAWVSSWTLLERGQALRWAAATCLHASDNDVKVPTRPACLDIGRPA